MSSSRALANHKLYLAKIQLAAWGAQLQEQQLGANLLSQAFLPAVRGHLLEAYGWLLLTLIDVGEPAGSLPQSVDQLPDIPPGKAVPGNLIELQSLEQDGWLADLLTPPQAHATSVSRRPGNLAANSTSAAGLEEAAAWCTSMEAVIERLGDSLDEC